MRSERQRAERGSGDEQPGAPPTRSRHAVRKFFWNPTIHFRFFNVPVRDGGDAAAELNRFLSTNRIIAIDRQLVPDGPNSAWAICVSFDNSGGGGRPRPLPAPPFIRRDEVDYQEQLSPVEFAVFSRLRALRKERSDTVPPPAPHRHCRA